jgi:hypothetical protein
LATNTGDVDLGVGTEMVSPTGSSPTVSCDNDNVGLAESAPSIVLTCPVLEPLAEFVEVTYAYWPSGEIATLTGPVASVNCDELDTDGLPESAPIITLTVPPTPASEEVT